MRVRCWGSRGSIPVSGKEYLKYGGDTTCIEIHTNSDDIIIVDAGTGIRRLGNDLIDRDRFEYNIIFTHAHWDHLMGFPFFKPLYLDQTHIKMHRCPFPSKYVKNMLSKVMAPPNFPVKYSDLVAKIDYEEESTSEFEIGSVKVVSIPLSHPNKGSGYKFIEDGKTFVFLTDNELGFRHPRGMPAEKYAEFCQDADLLFHDAEYTPEEYKETIEWGHSVYTEVIDLAISADVKSLGLFHLNQERTDREMDQIVKKSLKIIEKKQPNLSCFAVGVDMTFEL